MASPEDLSQTQTANDNPHRSRVRVEGVAGEIRPGDRFGRYTAHARALAINPSVGPVLLTSAELALLAGDPKGTDALTRALAIDPHDTRALVIRAGFERRAGHPDTADATCAPRSPPARCSPATPRVSVVADR